MPWVRKEDTYPRHRKIRRLNDAQYRMHDEAIHWCAEHLTDGHVPADELDDVTVVKNPRRHVPTLIQRGLWHAAGHDCPRCAQPEDPNGWVIHDYLDYNPSRADIEADRAAARKRMARRRRDLRGKFDGSSAEQEANAQENFAGSSEGVRPPRTDRTDRPGSSSNFEEPPNPADGGESAICEYHRRQGGEPGANCRKCGTNQRAVNDAAGQVSRPTWCGSCDETTRLVDVHDEVTGAEALARCPDCHPLSQAVPA